ncbi:Hypothetical protein AA314_02254 [Archangium gephyra]|uniref:Uncharacterized protein n=1 Tax=Archangium gephyra TaxID=48 RepID=A0AAC8TCB5_9BACT|nr:Hypothetical protein AA314_02254 [Archangium gephyra]
MLSGKSEGHYGRRTGERQGRHSTGTALVGARPSTRRQSVTPSVDQCSLHGKTSRRPAGSPEGK